MLMSVHYSLLAFPDSIPQTSVSISSVDSIDSIIFIGITFSKPYLKDYSYA